MQGIEFVHYIGKVIEKSEIARQRTNHTKIKNLNSNPRFPSKRERQIQTE